MVHKEVQCASNRLECCNTGVFPKSQLAAASFKRLLNKALVKETTGSESSNGESSWFKSDTTSGSDTKAYWALPVLEKSSAMPMSVAHWL